MRAAEEEIAHRSGRQAELTVQSVASQSELAQLMEKIDATASPTTVASPPPPPESLAAMQAAVLARVQPVMTAIWPKGAPLVDFDVAMSHEGLVVNVRYQAKAPLTQISLDLLSASLRDRLAYPQVTLRAQRVTAAEAKRITAKPASKSNASE